MNDAIFRNPEDILLNEIDKSAGKINCAKIGTVKAVNADGTATVELEDKTSLNCLLFCLAGAGAFIDFEDYKGASCLVVFCDDDLTRFKTSNAALKDFDRRKHTLNNGVALCGAFPFGKRPKGKKHFVCYEELNSILGDWSQKLLAALNGAQVIGAIPAIPEVPPMLNFLPPLPPKIDASDSKIGGITHND